MSFHCSMVRPVSSSICRSFCGSVAFFRDIVQIFRPRFVHRDSGVGFGFRWFRCGKQRDKVLLRHFTARRELHDQTFTGTHAIHHAHTVDQIVRVISGTRRNCLNTSNSFRISSCAAAACGLSLMVSRNDVLRAQLSNFSRAGFRVRTFVVVIGGVSGNRLLHLRLRHHPRVFWESSRTDVSCGRRHLFFRVRIDKTGDKISKQASSALLNAIIAHCSSR